MTPTLAHRIGTPGFGRENLPYCSFVAPDGDGARIGARIGDRVLDLRKWAAIAASELSSELSSALTECDNLDLLLRSSRREWDELRSRLVEFVSSANPPEVTDLLHDLDTVELRMPFTVADYVDFYASEQHATNVGHIFRPGGPPLTPNWKHLPIGYHGRAGTIVTSGTAITRPQGLRPETDSPPSFGPSRRLDIEAEVGFVVGGAAPAGRVSLADAREHLFGVTLVNDWSARDIQAFEYVPLGPFLGKSFATSLSPWITPIAALDFARVAAPARDVPVAPYLDDRGLEPSGFDILLSITLDGETVSHPTFSGMYWTAAQMMAHMTVNGASLRPGDFFASGTVSGPDRSQFGSFLEISWGGTTPLDTATGTPMTFLRDGQLVEISATAPGPDGSSIVLGTVSGRIEPALLT